MATKTTKSWYGVRTLVRVMAVGKPKWTDRYFDPASTLVEDRIVLVQATDFDDAIRQGEAEVRRYCRALRYVNIYGQNVRFRYLRAIDTFSLIENEIFAGCEVYSTDAIVPDSVRDARVVTNWWGKKERGTQQARNKFIHGKILTNALQAMKQSRTKRSTLRAAKEKIRS